MLYKIQGRAADSLENMGIHTITQLSKTKPDDIPDIPYLKGDANKKHAVLQATSWLTDKHFSLGPLALPQGQWVHFDIEDNPLTGTGEKHVYLWGFLIPSNSHDDTQAVFEYDWADHSDDDEIGWRNFLKRIEIYRKRYFKLILTYYCAYEKRPFVVTPNAMPWKITRLSLTCLAVKAVCTIYKKPF